MSNNNNSLKNGKWPQEKIRQKISDNHKDVNQMNRELNDLQKQIRMLEYKKSVIIIRLRKKIKYRNLLIKQLK